ncbi:MAG: chemotaxis protein CheW [Geminicoccaceae bacterium]
MSEVMDGAATAAADKATGRNIEPTTAADTVQLVAFSIGEQFYCVDIMAVREIRAWTGTTPLPNTANFVRGVINLRGTIVPIIDMRTRLGRGQTEPTKNHVVVIVSIGDRLNGLLVDGVTDIVTVRRPDIAPIPGSDGDAKNPYLDGLVTQEERMVALIALDRLVDHAVLQ